MRILLWLGCHATLVWLALWSVVLGSVYLAQTL